MPTVWPSASWSVLERATVSFSPSPVSTTSPTSSADSSERRSAPAKPSSRIARSRTSIRRSPSGATIAATTSVTAASLAVGRRAVRAANARPGRCAPPGRSSGSGTGRPGGPRRSPPGVGAASRPPAARRGRRGTAPPSRARPGRRRAPGASHQRAEVAQVRLVGAQRVGRLRAAGVGPRTLGQRLQLGERSPRPVDDDRRQQLRRSRSSEQARLGARHRPPPYARLRTEPTPDMGKLSGVGHRSRSGRRTAPFKWRPRRRPERSAGPSPYALSSAPSRLRTRGPPSSRDPVPWHARQERRTPGKEQWWWRPCDRRDRG